MNETAERPASEQSDLLGEVIGPVTVGPVAHGGHCVARHQGRVIFVRHALPGEEVRIKITDTTQKSYWRGDAVEVLQASPDRVEPGCPISGPGGCGGCDFQHVDLAAQRRLKADVLAEQLDRLAGIELRVEVEEVPLPDPDAFAGYDWRTRMRYLTDDHGRPGLRAHRSHAVIALPEVGCRIAARPIELSTASPGPEVDLGPESAVVGDVDPDDSGELIGVAAADGTHWFGPDERVSVVERAVGRDWQVAGDGFWQVHPAAADLLAQTVLDGLEPSPGETAFDLYCGVGLFTGALVDRGCRVTGVENDRRAVGAAQRNLADARSSARFISARVDRALTQPRGGGALPNRVDLVVLDPPRSGAGKKVVEQLVRRRPRAIAYVACDPAALARDLGYLARGGYRLDSLRAFDLFPMTHHLECVAIVRPVGATTTR